MSIRRSRATSSSGSGSARPLLSAGKNLTTKQALFEGVWPGRIVSESALASQVKALRRALDDRERPYRIIDTAHGQGLRIVCDVESPSLPRPPLPERPFEPRLRPVGRQPTIAVLTFAAIDEGRDTRAVSFALPDEISVSLAQVRSLHVIARSTSDKAPGWPHNLKAVGAELTAEYLVTGQVAIEDDRIALTIELVDSRDGSVLWREDFARPFPGLSALCHELVEHVVSSVERAIPAYEYEPVRIAPALG